MSVTAVDIVGYMIELGIHIDKFHVDYHKDFSDIGLDSLDRANLFLGVEEKYAIAIAEDDIDKLNTIIAVVDYINERC